MTVSQTQSKPDCDSLAANIEHGYALGWSFTPLAGKRPTLKAWQDRPRESLRQALAWAARGNVGLRTGQISGIVAIDVDPGAAVERLDLPVTVTVRTGRPGACHLYFRHQGPLGNSTGRLGPHIDVKADGGQVVFPGSVHPETGAPYTWAEGREPWKVELAELPAHIVRRLTSPAAAPSLRGSGHGTHPLRLERYARRAMERELQAVRSAVEGERNNRLFTAARKLGQLVGAGLLQRAEVEAALADAVAQAGWDYDEHGRRQTSATISSGIERGITRPRRIRPKATARRVLLPGAHKDDRDRVVEQSNADFADQVLGRLPADAIYRKDFMAGEILGPTGKRKWVEFTADRMRILIDSHIRLGKWGTVRQTRKQALVYQACSKDAAGVVVAHAVGAPRVRELRLMVSYPVYAAGFTRVRPGWHDGLYYDEPPELRSLKPETDCEIICNILHDLVVDFPFKSAADRQNFFGLLLTPVVAPAIDGPRPMHLLNAPLERTGKSKLVNEVFGGVITGRDTPSMQITEREEEREKRILAMLLAGETLMHLDNLPAYIDSPALASLLTTSCFLGRILGVSRNVSLPNNLTIVGTGNNVQASGEIAKRIVPIMIEPTSAHPEARCDFQHPDVRGYVRQHRRLVLECLLGLVENWLAAGRPAHPNRLGGFESWSQTIGGILQVNGLQAWRTNEVEWRRRADPRGQEWEQFVTAWHDEFELHEVTAKQLLDLAERHELFPFVFAKKTPQARGAAFGKLLQRHLDAPIAEWFIRRSVTESSHSRYILRPLSNQE